jgi:hypothetical protein
VDWLLALAAGMQLFGAWRFEPFARCNDRARKTARAQAKRAMQAYKLHFIDRWTGSILSFVDFEAASDAEACDHAAAFLGADVVELWCGARLVHRFPSMADDIYPLGSQHERPENPS